jgi:hypothetical protein
MAMVMVAKIFFYYFDAPGKSEKMRRLTESSAFSWLVETRIQDLVDGIRR